MSSYQKRKKSNFYNAQKAKKKREFVLKPGLKGFLCTCNNREKDCIRESYNILNEYADNLFGEEKATADGSVCNAPETNDAGSEEDIETALHKELEVLKAEQKKMPNMRRFQVVESGANNCIFIQTTVAEPVQLVHYIMKDLEATRKQKTRFLLRLLPIEATCKAYLEEIRQTADSLFDKYFTKEGKTFAVLFNRRNSSGVNREDLIRDLAEMVLRRHPDNKADLKHPQLAIIVEVIRNMCCLSVLPDYFQLRKYNLLELCTPEGGIKLINEKNDDLASGNREDNSETVIGQNDEAGGEIAVQEEITEQKNSEADADVKEGNDGKGDIGEISDSEIKSETEDQKVKYDGDAGATKIVNIEDSTNEENKCVSETTVKDPK